jgi:PAS domain S-box-containing protein
MRLTLEQQLTPHSLSVVLEVLSRELTLEEEGIADPDRTLKMELEYYHKDGSTRWMELVISGIRNDQGVLTAIHGVSRNITERKKAEEFLRESEYKYKSLIENIPDIIFTIDLEGKITFISKRTKDIIGYENSEMIKMSIFDLIPQEAHQSVMEKVQKGMKGQKIKHLKMPVKAKSGAVLFFEFSFTRIIKDGVVVGAQGTAVDITERKRTEEKLLKEEQRFRILAEQSSDIILLINREKEIIYENPAVDRILGLKREERIGKNVLENLHPDDVHRVLNAFDALMEDKNTSSTRDEEIRVRHADGSWRTFEVVASNLTNEHIVEAMIINLRDITERKQAEEKLQRTLDSLRKAVGTTIQVLVSAVESRDTYTAGHQSRSADLACAIATEMGLAQDKIEGIRMAGIIHDIGKLSIPAEILSKPTKLTEIEFALIKEHSQRGYEMLKDVDSPWPLAEIVYQHHERMNGSGYPRNLRGDEIIIESQILAVADVVEAMASHRPYRPTLGIVVALEEITKNKGILYNRAVVDACLRLFQEKGYKLS